MSELSIRAYSCDDRAACLALFDGNVPRYFALAERAEFAVFLDSAGSESAPFLVLVQDGTVVACGGVATAPAKQHARLCWGMVDRQRQGQGLGRKLTEARLALARGMPGVTGLALATSQLTRGFYEGFGFTLTSVIPDGVAPGLDLCEMVLPLTES